MADTNKTVTYHGDQPYRASLSSFNLILIPEVAEGAYTPTEVTALRANSHFEKMEDADLLTVADVVHG